MRRRSALERLNALAALRNLAEDADSQRLIVEQGGVPLLVAQLRSGSDAHKTFAAGALWHLSARPEIQVAIADAGGIPALLQLAESGNEVQRENATGAIMKLAETEANRARIVQAGGVAVLIGSIQAADGDSPRPMIQGRHGVLEPDGSFHPTSVVERAEQHAMTSMHAFVEQKATHEAKESSNPVATRVLVGKTQSTGGGSPRPMIQGRHGVLEPDGSFHPTSVVEHVEQQKTDEAKKSSDPASAKVEQAGRIQTSNSQTGPVTLRDLLAKLNGDDEEHKTVVLTRLLNSKVWRVKRPLIVDDDSVLVDILRGANKRNRVMATALLRRLSDHPKTLWFNLGVGALSEVTAMIRGGNNEEKLQAALLLEAMVMLCSKVQDAAVEAQLIPLLIDLAQYVNPDYAASAAGALGFLAQNPDARVAIESAGGIELLIGLVRDSADAVKTKAAKAVGIIAGFDDTRHDVLKGGGASALVALLRGNDDDQKLEGIVALSNIAAGMAGVTAIVEADGIPPIVGLLRSDNTQVKHPAAQTLLSLAAVDTNKAAIVAAGCISAIEAPAFVNSRVKRVYRQLLALLSEDTAQASLNSEIVPVANPWKLSRLKMQANASCSGDIPIYVALFRGATYCEARAMRALKRLVESGKDYNLLSASDCIEAAVRLIADEDSEHKTDAAHVLEALAIRGATRAKIVSAGGIQALFSLLRSGQDDQKTSSARALRNIFTGMRRTPGIACEDAVAPFIELLRSGSDEQKQVAVSALKNLAMSPVFSAVIGGTETIPLLVSLIEHESDDRVLEEAGVALLCLARSSLNWFRITEAGGFGNLFEAARDEYCEDEAVAAAASRAILAATMRKTTEEEVVRSVIASVRLIELDSDQDRVLGSIILRKFARQKQAIASAGGLVTLTELAKAGTEAQKELAEAALERLSSDTASNAPKATREEGIGLSGAKRSARQSVLAGVSAAGEDVHVDKKPRVSNGDAAGAFGLPTAVKSAVGNHPTPAHAASEVQLLQSSDGVLRADILALVTSIRDDVGANKLAAATKLCAMGGTSSIRGKIVRSGSIEELVALVRHGNSDAKTNAANVLESLALHGITRAEIVGKGGVRALYELMKSEVDEHKTIAARALRNIFAGTRRSLGMATGEVVAPFVDLLRGGSSEQKEIAVTVFQHLAKTPALSAAIGEAGALPLLVGLARDDTSSQSREAASAILALARFPLNWLPLVDADGFQTLVSLLRDDSCSQKKAAASVLRDMMATMYKFPTTNTSDVIAASIALIHHGGDQDMIHGCAILRDLAADEANRGILTSCGAREAMMELLAHRSDALKSFAKSALQRLAPHETVGISKSKSIQVADQPSGESGRQTVLDSHSVAEARGLSRQSAPVALAEELAHQAAAPGQAA